MLPPCIIITSQQEEPLGLIEYCEQEKIPVLRTRDSMSELVAKLDAYQ